MATRAPKFRRGMSFTDLSAAEWQTIADGAVKAHNLTVSTPLTVKHGKDTATVGMAKQHERRGGAVAAVSASIAWFKYYAYSANTDTFKAYPWDWSTNSVSVEGGEIPANLVHIAYPIELRRSYYHNKNVTVNGINYKLVGTGTLLRTSTEIGDTDNVETQIVIPRYSGAGDVLIAAIKGETGTFDAYSGGEPVIWQDLNLGARAWAKTSD